MFNNPLFSKGHSYDLVIPGLNTVYRRKALLLPRAKRLEAILSDPGPVMGRVISAYSNFLAMRSSVSDDFAFDSLKSRFSIEDNTLDRNLAYLNEACSAYGKFFAYMAKAGIESDEHSYVYSCGSNVVGGMIDPLAFRRSAENGFAHYVVKSKGGYDDVCSTYGILANRLTVSKYGGALAVSLSVPGDRSSLYRYSTAHQAIYFHEFKGTMLAVMVDSRALAKHVMSLPPMGFHTVFLGNLVKEGIVVAVRLVKDHRDNGVSMYDCESRTWTPGSALNCPETLRLGECPITGKCDQSKAIIAVGNRFCFTSIGQADLQENLDELGGSIPRNLSTGMLSTQRVVAKWLDDPRIDGFLRSPTEELYLALRKEHGKIPCSYARAEGKKTPLFLFESPIYDLGDHVDVAHLFAAVLGVEAAAKKAKLFRNVEPEFDESSDKSFAESCLAVYARKYVDYPLLYALRHEANAVKDQMMAIRGRFSPLALNESLMQKDYGSILDSMAIETGQPPKTGTFVYACGSQCDIITYGGPFKRSPVSWHWFSVDEGKLIHKVMPIDRQLPESIEGSRLIYHIDGILPYRDALGPDTVDFLMR